MRGPVSHAGLLYLISTMMEGFDPCQVAVALPLLSSAGTSGISVSVDQSLVSFAKRSSSFLVPVDLKLIRAVVLGASPSTAITSPSPNRS